MVLTISARNVEEAWDLFRVQFTQPEVLQSLTRTVSPRGLETLEFLEPVITTYTHPVECVLLDATRDANPFYHLYEALWMLNGCNDVRRLARYLPSIGQFSDDGVTFHGAYGKRLWLQLAHVVSLLRKDPDSRRAVLGIWQEADWRVATSTKDLPCNTTAYVKLRDGALHLTVCNRSNDAVWGCYGANAVQFSFLLQFLAGALEVRVGSYHQLSDSLHVYKAGPAAGTWQRVEADLRAHGVNFASDYSYSARGLYHVPLVRRVGVFQEELAEMLEPKDGTPGRVLCGERFLNEVVAPMLAAHARYRDGKTKEAAEQLEDAIAKTMQNGLKEAWKVAGFQWLKRRGE